MAEQNGANLQHQALRRQNDSSSANFAPYQHFYHPYGYQYNAYPQPINVHQYHQPVPHAHWSYYNPGPHVRTHQSYQPYGQYSYHHQNQYTNRQAAQPQHSYHSNNINSTDTPYSYNSVGVDDTSPHIPPMPVSETKSDHPTVSVVAFSGHRAPFYPPLPWLSRPDESFPQRQTRPKRRPRSQSASEPVKLPARKHELADQRYQTGSNDRDLAALSRGYSGEAQTTNNGRETKENKRGKDSSMSEENLQRPPSSKTASQAQSIIPVLPVVPRLPTATRIATTNNVNHANGESNAETTITISNEEVGNLHDTDLSEKI